MIAEEECPSWKFDVMTEDDVAQILPIERASYSSPWTRDNFLFEIRSNPFARNLVIRADRDVLAYACLWILGAEMKINNITVRPEFRRRGLGHRLLERAMRRGIDEGCKEAELEVRPSNRTARRLYERHGFREVRRRKGYYSDTREDAIVMAAPLLGTLPSPGRGGYSDLASSTEKREAHRMDVVEKTRERLAKEDPAYRRLLRKHEEYEEELAKLQGRRFLTEEEKLEEAKLKKLKLATKDEMERILRGALE